MGSRQRAWLLSAVASLAGAAAFAQDGPLFRFEMSAGPYPVGLKVVEQYDFSRAYRRSTDELGKPYAGERARPLQMLIWYPAKRGSRPMTVGDYGDLAATETSFGERKPSADAQDLISQMRPTLAMPLRAARDAPFEAGRFPVVIYAPSFSSVSWENADLCEYLASFGYVVVASPSMGAATRKMTRDLAGIDTQARDILFLAAYARTLPDADMSRLAVAGFSWGGISNFFAAARDSRIGALIALDGSMRYFPGLIAEAGDVHPEQMRIPLLYFASQLTLEDLARSQTEAEMRGPNVLNAWTHGDLVTVRMLGLVHSEFSSMFQRSEDEWKEFDRRQRGDYTRKDGTLGYAWVARYTLEFLDAYLKHGESSMAFLKKTPEENGAPAHVMAVSHRPGTGLTPSFDGFRAAIGLEGFTRTAEVYAAMQAVKPTFALDEGAVDAWAEELIGDRHLPEAISLLQLNVRVHPGSSDAYRALGDAYRRSANGPAAVDSFKKSLELDPDNDDARERLRELRAIP